MPINCAALLLSLGDFPLDRLSSEDRDKLVDDLHLVQRYREAGDPGLHGALDWLLRRWDKADQLRDANLALASRDPVSGRDWYINKQGQTMAVVHGPVDFLMGSPGSEIDRFKQEETQHLCRIPRSFAVAARKTTVQDFLGSPLKPSQQPGAYSPDPDCPMIWVSWYDAARYCQWLNQKEGIDEREWCYPKEIKDGSAITVDLTKTGYRLPTEAEWEYACRAKTITSRYYGSSTELMNDYLWCFNNAFDPASAVGERAWRVGLLRPNALGLFDMHGNVWDWCQSRYAPYPELPPDQPVIDGADAPLPAGALLQRVVRGGSFVNRVQVVRSAARNKYEPVRSYYYVGFRVVRTIR